MNVVLQVNFIGKNLPESLHGCDDRLLRKAAQRQPTPVSAHALAALGFSIARARGTVFRTALTRPTCPPGTFFGLLDSGHAGSFGRKCLLR